MKFQIIVPFLLISWTRFIEACCCGCCCCDCGLYTISTLPPPTTTTAAPANPIPPINRAIPPTPKRISMADYKKIQDIIDNTIKSRAKRYNYDLSAALAADSDHYRHGTRDELLDDEEDIEKHIPKTTTGRPTVSIIGAVNPQKLEGAPYIPAPVRNLKSKETGEPVAEEEAPELHRAKFR